MTNHWIMIYAQEDMAVQMEQIIDVFEDAKELAIFVNDKGVVEAKAKHNFYYTSSKTCGVHMLYWLGIAKVHMPEEPMRKVLSPSNVRCDPVETPSTWGTLKGAVIGKE